LPEPGEDPILQPLPLDDRLTNNWSRKGVTQRGGRVQKMWSARCIAWRTFFGR
jgi:hypothetical protein